MKIKFRTKACEDLWVWSLYIWHFRSTCTCKKVKVSDKMLQTQSFYFSSFVSYKHLMR